MASAFPPPPEEINPALPEETMKTSPEAVTMQNNADSPQKPCPPPLFISEPVEVCYTPKELLDFLIYTDKIPGNKYGNGY